MFGLDPPPPSSSVGGPLAPQINRLSYYNSTLREPYNTHTHTQAALVYCAFSVDCPPPSKNPLSLPLFSALFLIIFWRRSFDKSKAIFQSLISSLSQAASRPRLQLATQRQNCNLTDTQSPKDTNAHKKDIFPTKTHKGNKIFFIFFAQNFLHFLSLKIPSHHTLFHTEHTYPFILCFYLVIIILRQCFLYFCIVVCHHFTFYNESGAAQAVGNSRKEDYRG